MSVINFESTIVKDQPISGVQWVEIRPNAPIQQNTPVEFVIPNTTESFIDLSRTRLSVKCKITKANGDKIIIGQDYKEGEDIVAVTNFTLHTMWAQCDVYLQNRHVSASGWNGYPYKAYTDTILNFGFEPRHGWLETQMMYIDNEDAMEATDPGQAPINDGMIMRYRIVKDKSFDMEGFLFSDIFKLENPILNGVPIRVRLTPSPDSFRLVSPQSAKNFKLAIQEAKLMVCEVQPSPIYYSNIMNKLNKSPARYSYMKHEFFTHVASAQSLGVRLDNMFQGRIPTQMIVSLVKNKAFQGDYSLNPLNMQHFNVNYIDLNVNGRSIPNNSPLEPNFETGEITPAYLTTFTGTGIYGTPRSNCITRKKFMSGYTIYVFGIDPSLQNGDQMPTRAGGNVKLEIKFSKALSDSVIVMVHTLFPQVLEIDAARNINIV